MHGGYLGEREQLSPLRAEIVLRRTRERRLVALAQQGRELILTGAEQHRRLKHTLEAQAQCRRRIQPLGELCKQAIETLRYVLKQCIHSDLPPRCGDSL